MTDTQSLLYSEQFRSRVHSILSENSYWKDIVKGLQIDQKITHEVERQVQSATRTLGDLRSSVVSDTARSIPGLVAKEIISQMPQYLNQNKTMQDLFDQHSVVIQAELEAKATAILKKIVQDPEYHVIHKALFDEFRAQGVKQLDALREHHNELERNISHFVDEKLAKVTALELQTLQMKSQIERLQNWQTGIFFGGCALTVGLMSVFIKAWQK